MVSNTFDCVYFALVLFRFVCSRQQYLMRQQRMDCDDGDNGAGRGGRGALLTEPQPLYPEMLRVNDLRSYELPTPEEIVEIHRHLEDRYKDSPYFLGSRDDRRDPSEMLERLAPHFAKYFPAELRESRLQRGGASKKRKAEVDLSKLEKKEKSGSKAAEGEGGDKVKKQELEDDDTLQQAEDEMVDNEDYDRAVSYTHLTLPTKA